MTGWSAVAGTHSFAVPDEQQARGLAGALSQYGFALVVGRPAQLSGGWTVVAYDEGPYSPDSVGHRSIDAVGRNAAGRRGDSLLTDAAAAAAQDRAPETDQQTEAVHATVGNDLPVLLARWDDEPPAIRAILAALYPSAGQRIGAHIAEMAVELRGTQIGAYLELAHSLVNTDDETAGRIADDIVAWADDLDPGWLEAPGLPTTVAAGHVLTEGLLHVVGSTSD